MRVEYAVCNCYATSSYACLSDINWSNYISIHSGMLNDKLAVDAAQNLLASQFPHLQLTLRSQTSFTPIQESGG